MINMKKWSILLVVAVALMESCSKEKKANNSVKDHKDTIAAVQTPKNKPISGASDLVVKGDSVVIPDFKIEVNLSDKAVEKLQKNKESIIASLFFYGDVDDEDNLPEDIKKEIGPNGLKLAALVLEAKNIMQSNEFKINHFTFPKKLYDVLANKNISLNINVFSGRRAFKDNVLDMESFDSKFSEITTHGNFINLNGGLLSDQKNLISH
ncbi:hypothetical protein CMU85_14975 [Elizabethkingia anophelis]|uniref:Uncharacterized protein n=2 Tax=Elizabethkingia anophelis TaxID=1117645 RepID=A0A455ZEE5_9FLAO|nr:hypothetical protein [Elizabethkingia meningoseptica]AQX90543.1 hypothetical protein AYC67_16630 [Elizabethkingia anophelis]EHM7980957.1 hypothetical protein [Elizabethkingia anophelis]EHM8032176.1 hypothetical protein [Elizabethkingia anophelis]EHM8033931.1 hypothetical protein [Elizabethkingia anophelis]EKX6426904.1 hypothetical protein [Elizabethkingia anophelis]